MTQISKYVQYKYHLPSDRPPQYSLELSNDKVETMHIKNQQNTPKNNLKLVYYLIQQQNTQKRQEDDQYIWDKISSEWNISWRKEDAFWWLHKAILQQKKEKEMKKM